MSARASLPRAMRRLKADGANHQFGARVRPQPGAVTRRRDRTLQDWRGCRLALRLHCVRSIEEPNL